MTCDTEVFSCTARSNFLFQLILVSVLNCLYDAVSQMLKKNIEKRALLDNLDGAFLILDEICDNG